MISYSFPHTFARWRSLMALIPFFVGAMMMSCSESSGEVDEYADWQNKNTEWFTNLYNSVRQKVASGDNSWKILPVFLLNETAATKAEDHILVHVVNEGVGSGCPLYTDTVRVHYRGRLIPSPSYAEGLVFDQSWSGDYNLALMTPVKFGVAALTSGFSTAVMNMHIGDRWEVYIPYALGYGSAKSGSIPAYSALVFDITMMAYYHPGAPVPAWKANESFWEPGD